MKLVACLLIIAVLRSDAQEAKPLPAAVATRLIKQYLKCAREELKTIGVQWEKAEVRDGYLYVEYENRGEERDIFALACVLKLARVLAADCKAIQLIGKRNGKRLFNLTVPPTRIDDVYSADLTPEEKKRSEEILERCLQEVEGKEKPPAKQPEQNAPKEEKSTKRTEQEGKVEIARAPEKAKSVATTAKKEAPGVSMRPSKVDRAIVERPKATPSTPTTTSAASKPAKPSTPRLSKQQQLELAKALVGVLQKTDLENIKVGITADGQWFVSFENRTYRSDVDAVGVA
ncbi:MAG: hypothetical protein J7M38_03800, partial [Armatimonadetes bacterium]|nr:hypothetical protein [Armatimonadota bacterium]